MRSVENRWRESSRPLTVYGVPVGMFPDLSRLVQVPDLHDVVDLHGRTDVLRRYRAFRLVVAGVAATSSTHGAGKPEG
ncbi:hypothetical protein RKJ08_29410, partial [Klebsiella pneumoniae]|nr:hypothetical protein [Klebsiella pneumoniae]